jgi:hypothetical protein
MPQPSDRERSTPLTTEANQVLTILGLLAQRLFPDDAAREFLVDAERVVAKEAVNATPWQALIAGVTASQLAYGISLQRERASGFIVEREIRAGKVGPYLLLYASVGGLNPGEFACLIQPDANIKRLGAIIGVYEGGPGYAADSATTPLSPMEDLRRLLQREGLLQANQSIRDLVGPLN